jgi:hypothetical protein
VDDENKPDQSKWSQYLQFIWAILGDSTRLRRLVVVFILVVAAFVIVKGSVAEVCYELMQHVPTWGKTIAIAAGVGVGTTGSVGLPLYRKLLRCEGRARYRGKGPRPNP